MGVCSTRELLCIFYSQWLHWPTCHILNLPQSRIGSFPSPADDGEFAGGWDDAMCRGGEVPRTQPRAGVVCTGGDGAADLSALLPAVLPRVHRHFVWQRRCGASGVRARRWCPTSGPSKVLIAQSRCDPADSGHLPAHLHRGGLVGSANIPRLALGMYVGPSVVVLKVFDVADLGERPLVEKELPYAPFSPQTIWSTTNMSISPDSNENVGQEVLVPVQMEALVPVWATNRD
jgi:hypothetical protein